MGRGDKRTKRGKIWRGSYGKTRPHLKNKNTEQQPPQPEKKEE